MSCADVCLDHGYDEDNEFYREAIVTARKPHKCVECGSTIQPRARYERASGKNDGRVWDVKTCLLCMEIRKAFVCGTWCFGQLWDSIEQGMFPIWTEKGPIDCLAKVETAEARDKLREAYREWLVDNPADHSGAPVR